MFTSKLSGPDITGWPFLCQFLLCLSLVTTGVHATSIRGVSLDRMLHQSALVFEGRVQAVESRVPEDGNLIHTYVTFEILDLIKGDYADETIELRFLGGTLPDGRGLHVGDMHYPEVGEEGIYFVESLERLQVHPLYGWSQGHFRVHADQDGTRRVHTQRGHPVMDIDAGPVKGGKKLSGGVAEGVMSTTSQDGGQAMEVSAFKRKLRDMGE